VHKLPRRAVKSCNTLDDTNQWNEYAVRCDWAKFATSERRENEVKWVSFLVKLQRDGQYSTEHEERNTEHFCLSTFEMQVRGDGAPTFFHLKATAKSGPDQYEIKPQHESMSFEFNLNIRCEGVVELL
jgi:hypothetical protein